MSAHLITHADDCSGGQCGSYKCKCSCGYAPDSFACKIRHLQINTGDAKSGATRGRRQTIEVTPNGRVLR